MNERKRGFQKGRVPENRGDGEAYRWLMTHSDHQGNDCLIWPFYKDKNGRGRFGHTNVDGRRRIHHAPNFMCELGHGKKPTPKHLAVVICEGRKRGCCNPRHITWRTKSEELLEYYKHNPCENFTGNKSKYSPDKLRQVKVLSDKGLNFADISRRLELPYPTVFLLGKKP